jgi:hypothetical protein
MLYTLDNIFEYTEDELDNFLLSSNLDGNNLAEKRYLMIYYLHENNLFEDTDIIYQPNFLEILSRNTVPCLSGISGTKVVNVKVQYIRPKYNNLKEWCEDPNNIYIARKGVVFVKTETGKERYPKQDSIWANPFKIDKDNERENLIDKYRTYIFDKLEKEPQLRVELKKLQSKSLGCWCKPEACHGDVLLEAIEKYC